MSDDLKSLYRFRQIIEDRIWNAEHPEGPHRGSHFYRFTDAERARCVELQREQPGRDIRDIVREVAPWSLGLSGEKEGE
jgi:hypothetical protein